jgi:membrane-bound lytic murein transglycosylase D
MDAAQAGFRKALEVLDAPYARNDVRVREHADRLVARIEAAKATAQAQSDGFAERKQEPASIDQLLDISTATDQPAPTAETASTVAEDLQVTTHDIDIPLNSRVLGFVELFSGRLKGYLEDGLNRGTRYLPMIKEVFRSEGLPEDLAYVPLIESAFKPNAVSRAKARGMWQFMRGTALEVGLQHDWYIDERADPEKATRAAAKYLKTLFGMFGDWHLALASYNGGPGRVQRAMKSSKKKDFWSLTATSRYLPRETRDYVPLILAAVVVAKNPAQYGMNLAPLDAVPVEQVVLPTAVDLRKVAEWMELPVQSLQELNPELRRWTTPLRAEQYSLKVPEGMGEMVRQRLVESDPLELEAFSRYTVRKGETLLAVAKKLGVTRTDLAEANYLKTNAKLQTGQKLIVPKAPALQLAARRETAVPAVAEASDSRSSASPAANEPADAAPAPPQATASAATRNQTSSPVTHRVQSGETLFSIARLYRTTVASLKELNALRTNTIRTGQRLTVRAASGLGTN